MGPNSLYKTKPREYRLLITAWRERHDGFIPLNAELPPDGMDDDDNGAPDQGDYMEMGGMQYHVQREGDTKPKYTIDEGDGSPEGPPGMGATPPGKAWPWQASSESNASDEQASKLVHL